MRGAQKALLDSFGVAINRRATLYPWQIDRAFVPSFVDLPVPPDALAYLTHDNARLAELRERYAAFDLKVTEGHIWRDGIVRADDLRHFRGDNAFVFQRRGKNGNELSYALTYFYTASGRDRAILDRCSEDGQFGAYSWQFDGRTVTRDLLDSVSEIGFLQRHVGLTADTAMLDIGAGYGRLAHRITEATEAQVIATDGFADLTFLSEFYLKFRGSRASVVPLDEVERVLSERKIDIATNVHSFSECRLPAIDWWTRLLARHGVRYLMVIPNRRDAAGRCLTNRDEDMEAVFAAHGYRPRVIEPRYTDPVVQRWGVDGCLISLFELG